MGARDEGGVSDVASKETRTGEKGLGGLFPLSHMQTKENRSVTSLRTWRKQVKGAATREGISGFFLCKILH